MSSELPGLGRHRSVYTASRHGLFRRRRGRHVFGSPGQGSRRHARAGRRWPKRLFVTLACIVLVLILAGIGGFLYVYTELGGLHHDQVSALTPLKSGQPDDVMFVGSDSRQCDSTSAQAAAFGSKTSVTGQRSDTLMIARFVSGGRVELLSIPRDLWVPIAGTGGSAKINAAFDSGPNRLVQTVQKDLKIPINHVVMVNFCGLTSMVNALGGVQMDFAYPVRDQFSGLDVTHSGCQTVTGSEALQLVRSRHLFYFAHGQWNYDGMSDFSRILRQQAFFHALLDRLHSVVPNVFRLVSFVGAAAKGIAVDSGFSSTAMMSLGWDYHSLGAHDLYTSTLPTSEGVIDGQDVLLTVPQDRTVIGAFLRGDVGAFTSALGPRPRGARLLQAVVNPNALAEPWNPTPC